MINGDQGIEVLKCETFYDLRSIIQKNCELKMKLDGCDER